MRAKSSSLKFLAALLLAWAPLVTAQADAPQKIGVNAAVNTDANGTPPGGGTKKLVIGEGVVHNERITTDANGQTQILFIDGSSVSVGPRSDLTIDEFVFDPKTGTGKMTLTDLQGAMRFVGGKLSKQEGAVSVHLGTATIGVRGGIFLANTQRGAGSNVIFVFGQAVTVSANGQTVQLYRPGFATDISSAGLIRPPYQVPPGAMAAVLTQLDGHAGSHGGATTIPTNATVANSAVPNTVSNNVQVSIQQATSNAGPIVVPPTPVVSPPQVPTNQVQTTSSQTQPSVVNPTPPSPPTPPTPTGISGKFKIAQTSNTGFLNSVTTLVPFNATITYPTGSPGQNGTLNGTVNGALKGISSTSSGITVTATPLNAGQTTNVTGTAFVNGVPSGNTTSGPLTLTSDGDFFFADTTAQGGDSVFFFGGTPVSSSFYAATSPTAQFLAFAIQPDYTLGNGSQAQTIPFLPSFAGGTLSNAVVSPMYVVTQPNSPFGSFSASTNTGTSPNTLQASLAINGPTSNQQDAFVVATGAFSTSATFGGVVYSGPVRGTYMPGGTSPLTKIGSASTTVSDANNNSLFGGNSIDGFVLDQNQSVNGIFTQQDANSGQIGVANSNTSFGFNQPVLATTLPSGVGNTRTLTSETGFFGGVMENGHGLNYAIQGELGLAVNQANSTLGAVFVGTDPFTSSSSGVSFMTLPFGTLSGRNFARSTYIDDSIYGATESESQSVQITTPASATIAYPTESSGVTTWPIAGMVTSATVPGAASSLFQAAGATPCTCQYLQWGYWQANIPATNQGGPSNTVQSSYINTFVAGQPTINLPPTGIGSYSGAAIGTVNNNGVAYLAAGGYSLNYNFGSNTGSVSISNFDNHTFTSNSVGGGGGVYAATIAGSGANGSLVGQFYGPGAAETGGNFAVHQSSGPSYIASGIFAGKLTGPVH
ncbi:MAG: FecR family protein [Stellaceae bacterium]